MSERKPDGQIARARHLRRDMTDAEKKLWQCLRAEPFKSFHFRRQATIGPYFADFASHTHRVVIEIDGGQHAENIRDEMRSADLMKRGYRVLRFWNNDVLANIEGVVTAIDSVLRDTPHPQPLPAAGRGEGSQDA